ncbi:MAG: sigma factor-like helix-turn-helix DNA-binding protein [Candidatus Fervidibacter sacchari]
MFKRFGQQLGAGLWKRPLPVLAPSPNGFDSLSTYNPSVLRVGSKFWMFYRSRQHHDPHTGSIGLAESDDGLQWCKVDYPVLTPKTEADRFGCEDPRVIRWRNKFLMTYTGISGRKSRHFQTHLCIAFSRDGRNWQRQPMVLKTVYRWHNPFFKAAIILPMKWRDNWVMYFTGKLNDWQSAIGCAISSDLVHWQEATDRPILMPRRGYFDGWVVEVGTCVLEEEGIWLLYNGRDHSSYRVGYALLARDDPTKVLWRCERAILEPCLSWERRGVTPEVTFVAGGLVHLDGQWRLYYGAADTFVGIAMTNCPSDPMEPEMERWLSQTLRQFLSRFSLPARWNWKEWVEELEMVAWTAAVEAWQSFEERFGVPKELFVRQRVWNALKDYWRLEWTYGQQTASLNEPDQSEEGKSDDYQEQVADERLKGALENWLIRELVARLPERERLVIERLFWDEEGLTAIAKDLQISIPRVYQLKKQALARLRAWLQERDHSIRP